MSWTIDGTAWNIPCDIERTSEVRPSEISGMMLDKTYFYDVIGTYLSYDIALAVPYEMEAEYNALYEILNNPNGYHTFVIPYGANSVTIVGRIENIRDTYLRLYDGTQHWTGIKFSIISNTPTKVVSLSETVAYGLPEIPDIEGATEGDIYQYTNNTWVQRDYEDGDEIEY